MGEQSETTLSSGRCMVPPHLPLEEKSSGEKSPAMAVLVDAFSKGF